MFLGLIVFFVLAAVAGIVVIRSARALLRRLTGGGKADGEAPARKEGGKAKAAAESEARKEEPERESRREEKGQREAESPGEEIIGQRHARAVTGGITEAFSSTDAAPDIDPKAIADRCTRENGLTYLEFNNRELAGKDFYGFNLVIEEGARMVLTYNGQAVASLTKVEVRTTAVINGQEVEGTAPAWRINTFPPSLRPGLAPTDIGRMLTAADRVRACGRDPSLAMDAMLYEFTGRENVTRLKAAVDTKIQMKESGVKAAPKRKRETAPVKLH